MSKLRLVTMEEARKVSDGLLAALRRAHPEGPPADVSPAFEPVPRSTSAQNHVLKLAVYGRAWADGLVSGDGVLDIEAVAARANVRIDQVEALFAHRTPGTSGRRLLAAYARVTLAAVAACAFRLERLDAATEKAAKTKAAEQELLRQEVQKRAAGLNEPHQQSCMGGTA